MVYRTPYSSALAPGANTWLIPDFEDSYWAQRIDWYLNFQLNRIKRHSSLPLPEEVEKIIDEMGLIHYSFKIKETAPILVGCKQHLPTDRTIQLATQTDAHSWLTRTKDIWTSLSQPPLRIFLPKKISFEQACEFWKPFASHCTISIVPPLAPS